MSLKYEPSSEPLHTRCICPTRYDQLYTSHLYFSLRHHAAHAARTGGRMVPEVRFRGALPGGSGGRGGRAQADDERYRGTSLVRTRPPP